MPRSCVLLSVFLTGIGCAASSGLPTAAAPNPSPTQLLSVSITSVSSTSSHPQSNVGAPSSERTHAAYISLSPASAATISETDARCPEEMALIGGRVCIDRWEAIIVEGAGEGERVWSPFHSLDQHTTPYRAVSRPNVVPQGYISGEQALTACRASGKRLCGADEWVTACGGEEHRVYPYGAERVDNQCNDNGRERHPVPEASAQAGLSDEAWWREGMNLPQVNQLPDSLAPTGANAMCTTPEGVRDMVGNLHEWTEDATGTFRGGFYMDTMQNGEGCTYQTTAHEFRYHDYSTGFRCCMDPYEVE